MVPKILLLLFYLIVPMLLIYLCQVSKFFNRIGAVVLAYLVGMVLGNIGILPRPSEGFELLLGVKRSLPDADMTGYFNAGKVTSLDLMVNQISALQGWIMNLAVPLAIPLLLFSLDLKRWLKFAKGAVLSLVLGIVSLVAIIFIGYLLLGSKFEESWKVSGMLIGVYTGGSPNLAAIGQALDISPNTFILTNTYDMMIGAITLFFLMTIAQRTFNLFLPRFHDKHKKLQMGDVTYEIGDFDDYTGIFSWKVFRQGLTAFGFSVIILAVAGGLSMLFPPKSQDAIAILTVTTLGLAASNINRINKLAKSFQIGMYLVILFSLVIASLANLHAMLDIKYLNLFLFVALVVWGSIVIHALLSWLFRVDSDTFIITIAGLTYSPPFVPVIAGSLRNKDVIITGLTSGIVGYAIGNYLGISIAYLLK